MNIRTTGNGGDDKWNWNWPLLISLSGFALYRKHCILIVSGTENGPNPMFCNNFMCIFVSLFQNMVVLAILQI